MLEPRIKLPCYDQQNAQYSSADCGPVFGRGHDLKISSGCRSNSNTRSRATAGFTYVYGDANANHFKRELTKTLSSDFQRGFQVTDCDYEVFSVK